MTTISPANINADFDELHADVVGVGYGASGPADQPSLVGNHGQKIAGENVVDRLAGANINGHETKLLCDFDHSTRTDCNKMGSSSPRPLEYISSGGDSGGGLFRKKGNDWELVGLLDSSVYESDQFFKTGYYGAIMGCTRVSVFADWVRAQMK